MPKTLKCLRSRLKSNLKSAVPLPTASLRIWMREVAEEAVMRSADSLALGGGLGAALGLPRRIGCAAEKFRGLFWLCGVFLVVSAWFGETVEGTSDVGCSRRVLWVSRF